MAEAPAKAGFIQKYKAPLVIGSAVVGLMAWNFYQKELETKTIAAKQQAAALSAQQPYELALRDMQTSPDSVTPDESLPFSDEPTKVFGAEAVSELPAAGSTVGGELVSTEADQPNSNELAQAPAVEPATVVPPATAELSQAHEALEKANARIGILEAEIAQLKAQIESLKSTQAKPALTAVGDKSAKKPQAKPVSTQSKPSPKSSVAQVRPTAKPVEHEVANRALSPRRDIEFLGAFREGSVIRAHALVGNTVMELTQGQQIGNLKVESVSMEGVKINGTVYR